MKWYKAALVLAVLLVVLAACSQKADPEREAIINFTREALQIEAERAELMRYFADLRIAGGHVGVDFLMQRTFLEGVTASKYGGVLDVPMPHDLAGMTALLNRLLLLDSPQSMQPIKDLLTHIYESEIKEFQLGAAAYRLASDRDASSIYGRTSDLPYLYLPDTSITKDNVNDLKQKAATAQWDLVLQRRLAHPWAQLQSFRREVYIRWSQLLKEHSLDPAKEGFTALVLK